MRASEQRPVGYSPTPSKEGGSIGKQESYPVLYFSTVNAPPAPAQSLNLLTPPMEAKTTTALMPSSSSDGYSLPPAAVFSGDRSFPESKQPSVSNFRFEESDAHAVAGETEQRAVAAGEGGFLADSFTSLDALRMLPDTPNGEMMEMIQSSMNTPILGLLSDTPREQKSQNQLRYFAGGSSTPISSSRETEAVRAVVTETVPDTTAASKSGTEEGEKKTTTTPDSAAVLEKTNVVATTRPTTTTAGASYTFPPMEGAGDAFSFAPESKLYDFLDTPENSRSGGNNLVSVTPELPPSVVHRGLQSKCRFIAFPPQLPPHHYPSGGQNEQLALFIGQVRFETTASELIWLIHRSCGACASYLEGRGAGCYLVFLKSQADLVLVRGLHKRILFDVGGVWIARTPEEVDDLCEYISVVAPPLSKKAHLPRDSMVVEELKVEPNKFYNMPYQNPHLFHPHNNSNSNNNHHHHPHAVMNNAGSGNSSNNSLFTPHLMGGHQPGHSSIQPGSPLFHSYSKNGRMGPNNGNKSSISTGGNGNNSTGGGGSRGGGGMNMMLNPSASAQMSLPGGPLVTHTQVTGYPQGLLGGNMGNGGLSNMHPSMGMTGAAVGGRGGGSGGVGRGSLRSGGSSMISGNGGGMGMHPMIHSSDAPPSYFIDGGNGNSSSGGMSFAPSQPPASGGAGALGSPYVSSISPSFFSPNHVTVVNGGGDFQSGFNAYASPHTVQYVPLSQFHS